jgi:hypothetical protein
MPSRGGGTPAIDEGFKVERGRLAAFLTFYKSNAKGFQLCFLVLQQPQSGANHVVRGTVESRCHLCFDKPNAMVTDRKGCVLGVPDAGATNTKIWYRRQ